MGRFDDGVEVSEFHRLFATAGRMPEIGIHRTEIDEHQECEQEDHFGSHDPTPVGFVIDPELPPVATVGEHREHGHADDADEHPRSSPIDDMQTGQ